VKLTSEFILWVGGQHVSGATLLAEPARFEDALLSLDGFDGKIVITADGGELEYEDDLGAATVWLCFGAVPDLLAGRAQTVKRLEEGGPVQIAVEGDDVVITARDIPATRLPRLPLARALYECGERFMTVLRHLAAKRPSMNEYVDTLVPAENAARAALENR
jgi:hypothetical protein